MKSQKATGGDSDAAVMGSKRALPEGEEVVR